MIQLITYREQQTIKSIAIDDTAKYNELVIEAQEFELKKALSEPLYNDMLDNIYDEKYQKLLNGDSWISEGNKYTHKGMKFVLAYLVYSRWIRRAHVIDSYTGLVQQRSDYAEHISEGTIKQLSSDAYEVAINALNETIAYIKFYQNLYDKYICANSESKYRNPRIWNIRRY